MKQTSRDAAVELFSGVLKNRDKLVETSNLSGISITLSLKAAARGEVHRGLASVRTEQRPVVLNRDIVGGKPGYFFMLGERPYYIELQVQLGPNDGVAVPSRADFVIRPATTRAGALPIAIFTDGLAHTVTALAPTPRSVWRSEVANDAVLVTDLEGRGEPVEGPGRALHNYLTPRKRWGRPHSSTSLATTGFEDLRSANNEHSFAWLLRLLAIPIRRNACRSGPPTRSCTRRCHGQSGMGHTSRRGEVEEATDGNPGRASLRRPRCTAAGSVACSRRKARRRARSFASLHRWTPRPSRARSSMRCGSACTCATSRRSASGRASRGSGPASFVWALVPVPASIGVHEPERYRCGRVRRIAACSPDHDATRPGPSIPGLTSATTPTLSAPSARSACRSRLAASKGTRPMSWLTTSARPLPRPSLAGLTCASLSSTTARRSARPASESRGWKVFALAELLAHPEPLLAARNPGDSP